MEGKAVQLSPGGAEARGDSLHNGLWAAKQADIKVVAAGLHVAVVQDDRSEELSVHNHRFSSPLDLAEAAWLPSVNCESLGYNWGGKGVVHIHHA